MSHEGKIVKPIETIYNGYKFRSRLEARWAVFFDALNLQWDYEPEGYDLCEYGYYLPDFWVHCPNHYYHNAGYWVEIKPTNPTDLEMKKCQALTILTKHATCLLVGGPWPGNGYCRKWHPSFSFSTFMDFPFATSDNFYIAYPCGAAQAESGKSRSLIYVDQAIAANKAKQARFEHGENG